MQHRLMRTLRRGLRCSCVRLKGAGWAVINEVPHDQEDSSQANDDQQHEKEEEERLVVVEELPYHSLLGFIGMIVHD